MAKTNLLTITNKTNKTGTSVLNISLTILLLCTIVFIIILHNIVQGDPVKPLGTPVPQTPTLEFNRSVDYALNTSGCIIVNFGHWLNLNINRLNHNRRVGLNCKSLQLFYADGNILKRNVAEMKKLINVECIYLPFYRKTEDEVVYKYPGFPIYSDVIVKDEFVKVVCTKSSKTIYEDVFATIVKKPEVERRCEKILSQDKKNDQKFNVLMLGLDSVSKIQYQRYLYKTDAYIRQHLNYMEFTGYNKVASGTFANIVPLLTGKLQEDYDMILSDLDFLPIIWQNFSHIGYRTLFAEDTENLAAFGGYFDGFVSQPTDYYLRPLFTEAGKLSGRKSRRLKSGCLYNRTESSVVLDWMHQFFDVFKTDPVFASVMLSRFSTRNVNYKNVGLYDHSLVKSLKTLHSKGHLNTTIVFFFSTRGYQYENMSNSYMKFMENNLPFLFVILPPKFSTRYPILHINLENNQERLVTSLDIHETMIHITKYFNGNSNHNSSYGTSLFELIRPTRNCKDAHIDIVYCSCINSQLISPENDYAKLAAGYFVWHLNNLTQSQRTVCFTLFLSSVLEITEEKTEDVVGEYNGSYSLIQTMAIKVIPSGNIFKGVLRYFVLNNTYAVDENIEKADNHGNPMECVDDDMLKPICYCYMRPSTESTTTKDPLYEDEYLLRMIPTLI